MESVFETQILKYVVLPTKLTPDSPSIPLLNRAYDFWSRFWNDVYQSVGTSAKAHADQFYRQDALSIILDHESIVAMHCYTFFNLQLTVDREHSFFTSSFTTKAMTRMLAMGMRSVMTMEYFAVAKEWQKRSRKLPMGVILISLSQRFFLELGMDMWIGIPRADIGVAKLCYDMGAIALDRDLTVHGVKSDLIGVTPERAQWVGTSADKALIKKLWDNRDLRFELPAVSQSQKAA